MHQLPWKYALIVVLLACSEPNSPSPSPSASPVAEVKPKPVSLRKGLSTWRALMEEAARAELYQNGLLIDFGNPDEHKYTRGGWRSDYGASTVEANGVTHTAVDGHRVYLDLVSPAPVKRIYARVRSVISGQRIQFEVRNQSLGDAPISKQWTTVEIPIKGSALAAGRRDVSFVFGHPNPNGPRAQVDWIWLSTDAKAKPAPLAPRVLPVSIGGVPKRALVAPTARTYSFYLHIPENNAFLVFGYGADKPVTFTVHAKTDERSKRELFSQPAKIGAWKQAKVDLSEFAGRAIRLDLTTKSDAPAAVGWGEPEIMVATSKSKVASTGDTPRNVVMIVIDTVRADAYSAFNPASEIRTPAFDKLATKSLVFANAYNNENWTKPSVATILTGLYPTTHDTKRDQSVLPSEVELLSERLQGEGFDTAAFVANGFISDKFGFAEGWDVFRNYIRENKPSEAEYVYADALTWLAKPRDKPFFLYLQTIDPHVEYSVGKDYTNPYFPAPYKGQLGASVSGAEQVAMSSRKLNVSKLDRKWVEALYYGEISYHDEHMGLFLHELEKQKLLANTMIVVTNDHGEELGERGRWGHGHSLYEEMIRAPLLFHYPPIFSHGKRTDVVEHVDVTPTILEALRLKPLADADGQSLLPLVRGAPDSRPSYAVSEFLTGSRALRVGRWKLIRSTRGLGKLYDIKRDPRERKNRAKRAPIALRLCEVYLGEALATPTKRLRRHERRKHRKFNSKNLVIDPKLRKQLEALGYLGGQ